MKALSRSEWLLLLAALSAIVLWHRDAVAISSAEAPIEMKRGADGQKSADQ